MKKAFDIAQVLLLDGGAIGYLAWVLVVWMVLNASKIGIQVLAAARWIWRQRWRIMFRVKGLGDVIILCLIAACAFFTRGFWVAQIQMIEQRWVSPTYVVNDSSAWATSVYESEIKRHTSEREFQIVRDSTYSLAQELGCEPIDIYEVAYSECGMNPYCVRKDGIAAGWIQFTVIGLQGLGVTLDGVKEMCRVRDAVGIMALTGRYMRRAAKGRKLLSSTEVYTAVFAPGKVSAQENEALYSGWKNPAYYLNAPALDGYFFFGEKVVFLPSKRDGVITKLDMRASLAYKKATLLRRYK